jgi:RNA polymerase sigma-70 factor (ECF subfamily)
MMVEQPRDAGSQDDGSTSQSLLRDVKRADQAAWRRLVELYAPLVAALCRRWHVPNQDVADLVQEVFSAVAGNLEHFRKQRPADTFRGWLATITRNKTRDYFRRQAREPAGTGGTEASLRIQHVADQADEDGLAVVDDEPVFSNLVRRALESIRPGFHEHTWRAFWGVAVDGRAAADVAADLGMSQGAVRVAKLRVLVRLRRELGDLPPA